MRIRITIAVMIAISLSMFTASCADYSALDSRIYTAFRNYRMALLEEDEAKAITYFDRSVLEASLSSLLRSDSDVIEHNLKAESMLFFFGRKVVYVFSRDVKCRASKCYLGLIFKNSEDGPFMKVDVEYRLAGDKTPLISGLERHWYEVKMPPKTEPIDSFVRYSGT